MIACVIFSNLNRMCLVVFKLFTLLVFVIFRRLVRIIVYCMCVLTIVCRFRIWTPVFYQDICGGAGVLFCINALCMVDGSCFHSANLDVVIDVVVFVICSLVIDVVICYFSLVIELVIFVIFVACVCMFNC